jgi:two-component system, cell cycle response regulator DivK
VSSSTPHAEVLGSAPPDQPLVLIVDDNEANLKLARDVLRADGLRTLQAANGTDAIAIAMDARPDVILLDLRLPDVDGVDVLRALKARERTALIPVVALTALGMGDDRAWLRETGFSGYLEKPIDVRAFPGRVRGYAATATA